MGNSTRNSTVILFLSDYNSKDDTEKEYTDPSGEKFKGTQTNDAPTKYLLKTAADRGEPVSKILCITSKKVFSDNVKNSDKPAFVFYEEMVENYCDSVNYQKPEIVPIFYDFKGTKGVAPEERPMYIYRQIAEELNKSENTHIYVDYTGGVRDTSFLMTVIIRYLEFETIQCEEIVYSNYTDLTIYNITYIYDMFQMINGASEFVETGNAKQLNKISTKKLNDDARKLVKSIVDFSNTISLCDIGKIDAAIKGIAENLKSIENIEKSKTASDDIFVEMLRSLVPIIKEKMYIEVDETGKIDYPKLVQWCAENGLIQQAVTLYIEKMPKYYYENDVIPDDIKQECDAVDFAVSRGATKETTAFYKNLFKKYSLASDMKEFQRTLLACRNEDGIIIIPENFQWTEAGNRLNNIKDMYDNSTSGISFSIYESIVKEKNFRAFCNSLANNEKYTHYLLVNNADEYDTSRSTDQSILNKVAALKNMEKNQNSIDEFDVIFPKMKYYLALKLIRNRMNHASEEDMKEAERVAIKWLEEQGIKIDMKFDKIKGIILAGIES